MKQAFLLLILANLISLFSISQRNLGHIDNEKYRINLPDYWGKGNKVWHNLIEKLPLLCEELKGKDLCGDKCNPAYTIDFYITEAIIFDYTAVKKFPALSTNTQLNARQELARMQNPLDYQRYNANSISTAGQNNWNITTNYGFQCFLLLRNNSGKLLTKIVLVDTNQVWSKQHLINLSSNGNFSALTPQTYIENSESKLRPLPKELMEIAEQKLLSM